MLFRSPGALPAELRPPRSLHGKSSGIAGAHIYRSVFLIAKASDNRNPWDQSGLHEIIHEVHSVKTKHEMVQGEICPSLNFPN